MCNFPIDIQEYIDFLKKYLHINDSEFLDSLRSACDNYMSAVNMSLQDEQNKMKKKNLLEQALEHVRKCFEIKDEFSQLIDPQGLLLAIEQELELLLKGNTP